MIDLFRWVVIPGFIAIVSLVMYYHNFEFAAGFTYGVSVMMLCINWIYDELAKYTVEMLNEQNIIKKSDPS